MTTKLTLADISDLRAYERERDAFRARIIALKKRRRVSVGPVVTLLFENRETVRFQIQEMARAEKIISDEGVQTELNIYNPLVPEPGALCATLFLELTSDAELRDWLPRLIGIEQSIELRFGLDGADRLRCVVDEDHATQLTREATTASVHYIRFELSPDQIESLAVGPAWLAVDHPQYQERTALGAETMAELLADLRAMPENAR